MIAALIEHRGQAVPAPLVETARRALATATANDQMADRMAAFLRKGAK